jgi:hypothetical protein
MTAINPIVLDELDVPEMWQLIIWMSERSRDWVLIGGLMVASFDLEYGHPWRQTHDVDSLFDVRHARRGAIRDHVQELREIGFEFVTGRQGLGHRLASGELVIDILSTEHFPEDPLVSLDPRLETFQTPGGSQAVKRREVVVASFQGATFGLPRPNLLGAIMLKAAASATASRPKDHRDLAHLVAKADDLLALRQQLRPSERRLLASRLEQRPVLAELAIIGHDAVTKLRLLASPPT